MNHWNSGIKGCVKWFSKTNWKIKLIDNDTIANYGSKRQVGTPGFNVVLSSLYEGEIVSNHTDDMGWENTLKALKGGIMV